MLRPEQLIIEARNKAKDRIGQIALKDIRNLEIVLNHNNVGTWSITISADHPLVKTLRKKGAGLVVATDAGTIISGNMTSVKYEYNAEDPTGFLIISGVDDNQYLADALAYPDPANNAENQTKAKDTRSGSAEAIMKGFVRANIGPDAIASRKIANLTIETNADRGAITTKSARFKNLGIVCYEVASTADLGFRIAQVGDNIQFQVYEPVDRTADIEWSIENQNMNSTSFEFNAPVVTHAIVGGEGKGVDRLMKVYSTTASAAAASDWGRRIETFVDTKESDTDAELTQAGKEAIKGGLVTSAVEFTPEDATSTYMTDWNLGDLVKVVINEDVELIAIIDSVGIILNNEGITIKASVNKSNRKSGVSAAISNIETTNEGSGYKRVRQLYSMPSLASGETYKGTLSIASGWRLLRVEASDPCRLRLYATTAGRDADEIRPENVYPNEASGLLFDFVFADFLLDAKMNPTVDGFTQDGSANVPFTIENRKLSTTSLDLYLTFLRTE